MEIELERTFLLKEVPQNLRNCKSIEGLDMYIPQLAPHPILRIRRRGDIFEMTKKSPIAENDSSEQEEQTISLSEEEFSELSNLKGKRLRKVRYYYPTNSHTAEIDVFLDGLEGLILADFEFDSLDEKSAFTMPEFCLVDVTQEKYTAGGFLAGKNYSDIQSFLDKFHYQKLVLE